MTNVRVGIAILAAALALFALPAFAQPAPPAPSNGPGPAATFAARCKSCHEPAIDRAPDREELARRNPEVIVAALSEGGAMAPMAAGLNRQAINDIASYLTGRVPRGVASAPQPPDPPCKANPPIRATASDWVGFGHDPAATRMQPNPGFTAGDVPTLKLKWAFSLGGGRYGQPTVVGDHLFVATGLGHVFSLDAASGCVHWRADIGSNSRTSPIVSRVAGRWTLFVGDAVRTVHALDAQTGKELWKTAVDAHPRGRITGGPAYADGTLYVPLSSSEETIATVAEYRCCTFSGSVAALDASTGKLKWKTFMLPPAQPTRKNAAGTQMLGPAGAAIWSQPAIDAKRHRLYVTTGDSYTEVKEPRSDSVVALDLSDGRILWTQQVTEDDNFLTACFGERRGVNCPTGKIGPDVDFGASPILAHAPGGKDVVLAGQKSGVAYGFDPDTGKRLWATKLGEGSPSGGVEWGMAYDGRRLFVPIADGGRPNGKPGIYAVDPLTGALTWSAPSPKPACSFKSQRCVSSHSAPAAAMPGAVFAGTHDGWLRAFDVRTGKPLLAFDTAGQTYQTVNGVKDQPGGSVDAVGPVLAGGRLFVVSGYTGATGAYGNPLNVLLAFEPAK
jgi:polyvinyl alcohol dehydrogenase (cytochrome)